MKSRNCDVVVVGGGAGGCAAAVGAAQAGAQTVLVERWPYLGGAATTSNVLAFCGFFTQSDGERAVRGVGQAVLDELSRLGFYSGPTITGSTGNLVVPLDPEATKIALDRVVLGADVHLLLHSRVMRAWTDGRTLDAIECAEPGGSFVLRAKAYVDASGDGSLTATAGGLVEVGNRRGEFQAGTMMLRLSGVPEGLESRPRELVEDAIRRSNETNSHRPLRERVVLVRLPNHDVLLVGADEKVNGLSADSLTHAEISGREQGFAYVQALRSVPGCEGVRLVSSGPRLGVRETRHCVGLEVVRGLDVRQATRRPDGIARGAWPIELHDRPGVTRYESILEGSYFDVPYGALCSASFDNLWLGGRAIWADDEAYGSVRVMGTAFATGHAAGIAAAKWAASAKAPVKAVRAELVRQGALI